MFKLIYLLAIFSIFIGCETEEQEMLRTENSNLKKKLSDQEYKLQLSAKSLVTLSTLARSLQSLQADIVTNRGTITVKFFPEKAPIHVMNFVLLSEGGFYNGVKFHRVIKNFMIQAGDPNSKDNNPNDDGTGGSLVNLPSEFSDINHARGILSMARSQDPNSASSQFFIMHAENAGLNMKYSAFGEVTKGMEVVDAIANTPTINKGRIKDRPAKDVIIKNIRVYRAG